MMVKPFTAGSRCVYDFADKQLSSVRSMVGARLEVDLHIATCSGSALQSTVTCANRAGLEVSEAVLESIAAAESTLSADERELGVCLLDIGAHSSDMQFEAIR